MSDIPILLPTYLPFTPPSCPKIFILVVPAVLYYICTTLKSRPLLYAHLDSMLSILPLGKVKTMLKVVIHILLHRVRHKYHVFVINLFLFTFSFGPVVFKKQFLSKLKTSKKITTTLAYFDILVLNVV